MKTQASRAEDRKPRTPFPRDPSITTYLRLDTLITNIIDGDIQFSIILVLHPWKNVRCSCGSFERVDASFSLLGLGTPPHPEHRPHDHPRVVPVTSDSDVPLTRSTRYPTYCLLVRLGQRVCIWFVNKYTRVRLDVGSRRLAWPWAWSKGCGHALLPVTSRRTDGVAFNAWTRLSHS